VLRFLCGLLYLGGMVIMAWNLAMTAGPAGAPAPLPATAKA
jgi:hypothetical protein